MAEIRTRNANGISPPVPSWLHISEKNQFQFGGESACPFGTLEFAQICLARRVTPENDYEQNEGVVRNALEMAVSKYHQYFQGQPEGHANPIEIFATMSDFYFDLELVTWPQTPDCLMGVSHALVFPEAFLPMGEIQLQRFGPNEITELLLGFCGSNQALSFVNIGYVFGVFCSPDGSFYIFDTHSKDFSRCFELPAGFVSSAGAFIARYDSIQDAADFILQFVLDSRNAIIQFAGEDDDQQFSAASNLSVAVFARKEA